MVRLCGVLLVSIEALVAPSARAETARQGWKGETADWMKFLPDETPLARIMMPASHDGAMVEGRCTSISSTLDGYAQLFINQSLTVGEQLEAGSRYVELRPYFHKDEVCSSHCTFVNVWLVKAAIGGVGESFSTVFSEVRAFLEANRSEVVFLNIWRWGYAYGGDAKKEQEIRRAVRELMNRDEFRDMFYRWPGDTNDCPSVNALRLADVRGKVIAICEDTDPDVVNGIWGHTDTASETSGRLAIRRRGSDTEDVNFLITDQLSVWKECEGIDPVDLAYAASFELTWQFSLKDLGNSNLELSKKANPCLSTFLEEGVSAYGKGMAIYTDYVTADTARTIIAYNFPVPSGTNGGGWLPLPPRPDRLSAADWAALQGRFAELGVGEQRIWDVADWVNGKVSAGDGLLSSKYLRASFDLDVPPIDEGAEVRFSETACDAAGGFSFRIRIDRSDRQDHEFVTVPAERIAPYVLVSEESPLDWRPVDADRLSVDADGRVTIMRQAGRTSGFVRLLLPEDR